MSNPHPSPPLTREDKERIRQRIAEGLTVKAAAQSVGRPFGTVASVVNELGGVRRIRAEALKAA